MPAIEKRGKDSYRLTVSAGYDSNGKKIFHHKTINLSGIPEKKQSEEAEKQWYLFQKEIECGTYIDAGKITFAEFTERWLTDYAEKNLAPKTLYRYKEMLNSRIIPALGHLKLDKIQPTHLLEFYNILAEDGIRNDKIKVDNNYVKKSGGLSERTILHHHRLISSILQDAVEWQLISNNPASRVKPPKVTKHEIQYYNEEQAKELIKALETEPLKYKVMVLLDLFTGLRCGELMGLEWSDIDFDKNTIEVNKASQYISGKGTFTKGTKNRTSERMISVPEYIISLLKQYKSWQNEEKLKRGGLWQENNRLFTTWDGKPLFTYTLTNWFPEFLQRHQLPKITPHGLRHTSATLLAAQGLEVPAISKRLGHARTSTTMDIYAHALQSADKVAADMLENLLVDNKSMDRK